MKHTQAELRSLTYDPADPEFIRHLAADESACAALMSAKGVVARCVAAAGEQDELDAEIVRLRAAVDVEQAAVRGRAALVQAMEQITTLNDSQRKALDTLVEGLLRGDSC
ncbi:hypothetical protein [Burkholderia pseudomultivorans]|uniref:hypothetical protein n=1 Tax=Burkholderia pseudomultivorans TaxID=1207504 RepID=UPI00075C75D8|nr:hypothetical protein [Burkholderia pseudomultivorans]KVC26910.1 hypothetical protein WS55_14150 [Burkholderia pseudomultivorans]KVC31972.1 hypothetical protein WS56_15305 [Burkholderia pseudomultivorans]